MLILYWIVEYLASFIEAFFLFQYHMLLHKTNRTIPYLLLSFIGALLVWLFNHISIFSYYTIIIFVIYMTVTSTVLFHEKVIWIISINCFYTLCLICLDFVVASSISAIYGNERLINAIMAPGISRMLFIVIMKVIWVLLFLVLRRFYKMLHIEKTSMIVMLIISIGGYIGFSYLVNYTLKSFTGHIVGFWLTLLLLLIMFLFFIMFRAEIIDRGVQIKYEKMHNSLLEEKYDIVSDTYTKNAKLYHDLNNHLNILYQLLRTGATQDAIEYIDNISKPIQSLSRKSWTGDNIVDVILNSEIEKMRDKDILYEINVEYPHQVSIASTDICTVLSNLLDNAVEATELVDEKDRGPVSITMRQMQQFLVIRISNPTILDNGENPELRTTKQDKTMHGWGISNVRSVVEKYNGSIEFEVKDHIFRVTVLIMII